MAMMHHTGGPSKQPATGDEKKWIQPKPPKFAKCVLFPVEMAWMPNMVNLHFKSCLFHFEIDDSNLFVQMHIEGATPQERKRKL